MIRVVAAIAAGLGVGFLLGQRGIPQTLDEVDRLRRAIEERELARAMRACGPPEGSAA